MSTSGLTISGLHCGYGRHEVLKGLDVCFPAASFTTIVGANGCGKSTLLKTLIGVVRARSGQVTLDGEDLLAMRPHERAEKLGYVAQTVSTASHGLTALEVIQLGLGRQRRDQLDEVFAVAERLGLSEVLPRPLHTLSGGQQQRVQIARALAQGARTILLDEPISSLDLKYQVQVMDQLHDLAVAGHTVVAVIHDLNMAAWSSDHVVLLEAGRCLASGPAATCLTPDLVESAFDIRVERAFVGSRSVILPASEETP